jgi:hypothetical protein
MIEENPVPLRPYNSKELAAFYGVNSRTFYRWLSPYLQHIGPRSGRFFTQLQVEIIFQALGRPKVKRN